MIAFLVFEGVTALALLLGWLAFRIVGRASRWVSIPATVGTALLSICLSAIAYLAVALTFPANDALNWSDLDKIEVYADLSTKNPRIDERALPRNRSNYLAVAFDVDALAPDLSVVVSYPSNVRNGDDATIALTVSSRNGLLSRSEYRAVLRSAETMKIWTTETCSSSNDHADARRGVRIAPDWGKFN
jgi:hypothetical protein